MSVMAFPHNNHTANAARARMTHDTMSYYINVCTLESTTPFIKNI